MQQKLNMKFVNSVSTPGKFADTKGHGLYLIVKLSKKIENGFTKTWVQRIIVRGRIRDFGLGSVKWVSLEQARIKANDNYKIARAGGDPSLKVKTIPTFREAFEEVLQNKVPTWKKPKIA